MSPADTFDFTAKLKDDETLLWTGRGSGRNFNRALILPVLGAGILGSFLLLGFPLSGFQIEMAWVALWGLAVSGIVIWFFRARMLSPPDEEYAITSERVLIVSGPIGRVCRSYRPKTRKHIRQHGLSFYAVKHVRKTNSVKFLPARSNTMPQGFPPIFVGVENARAVAELAADTFSVKLIHR